MIQHLSKRNIRLRSECYLLLSFHHCVALESSNVAIPGDWKKIPAETPAGAGSY